MTFGISALLVFWLDILFKIQNTILQLPQLEIFHLFIYAYLKKNKWEIAPVFALDAVEGMDLFYERHFQQLK